MFRFAYLFLFFFTQSLSAQIIIAEHRHIHSDSSGIEGSISLNLSIQKTTKNLVSISNGGRLTYFWPKQRIMLFGQYSLVKGEGESFSNNGFAHLRYNKDLSEKIELEIFTQSQFNKLTRISQRWLNGIGARFRLTEYEDAQFHFGIAYMNEYEKIIDETDNLSANRLNSYFSFNLDPYDDVSYKSITYFQPRITNWSDFRVLNQNELTLVVNENIEVNIRFLIIHDSATPEGIPNLTYNLLNGLDYKF